MADGVIILTPPGGNLGSTDEVFVGADFVLSEPVLAALVAPDFVCAAVPLAAGFSAPPVAFGRFLPVSAGEELDAAATGNLLVQIKLAHADVAAYSCLHFVFSGSNHSILG